ncbi:MAG: RNA polymerase sigma factor, partial [Solirubrobacterales bacterium]|nr:RNA polymerase sigma factor [Solirubrobacterales bacterium]
MEASALHAPARFGRLTASPALLRLRSDEQLVSLLRAGSQEAFNTIHERYRQRLFAYVRQMLGPRSRQDAEDVLQDVFARAYTALLGDNREVNLRPWLYRVAHNRCIDHLRRPGPVIAELTETETATKPLHDPFEDVQRREDLKRLVADIGRLPTQQKSALLLREINGLSYNELAEALDVTVPAIKSLLVRARVELVETAEARDVACASIREELLITCDTGGRTAPRTRRHLRDCAGCREYQNSIRGMRRSFAALSPVAVFGPLALLGKLIGLGG